MEKYNLEEYRYFGRRISEDLSITKNGNAYINKYFLEKENILTKKYSIYIDKNNNIVGIKFSENGNKEFYVNEKQKYMYSIGYSLKQAIDELGIKNFSGRYNFEKQDDIYFIKLTAD